ncbi:MAG: nucleotidyltransferase domain-containing protein [Promethearchaeia archaeon]
MNLYRESAIESDLKKHKQTLKERFNVKKIGIFGSYSRNDSLNPSD